MRAAILLLLPALSSCNSLGPVPSLAPRPIEKIDLASPPPLSVAAPAPLDAGLAQRVTRLIGDARDGGARFDAADRANGATIARGLRAAEGSDAWITAQTALSALEAGRQQSAEALASIDGLLVAQAAGNGVGMTELEAARDEASAIVARQSARLAELTR